MLNKKYQPSCPVFELTLKCNLNCKHCGSTAGEVRKDELSTKEAIRVCKELAEIGTRGVALMGGEVLLRKDWKIISKEIKKLDMFLSIVTNGYIDPKKIIPDLKKLEVDSISIGFDGDRKTHNYIRGKNDAFTKTLKFIELLQEEGLNPCPLTTFHKLNFNEFFQIRDIIVNRGLDWHINVASLIGRFPKKFLLSYEEYYELGFLIAALQKKYSKNKIFVGHNLGFNSKYIPNLTPSPEWQGCHAGIRTLGIKSNGDINGCLPLPDRFTEGNIKEKSIIDIWNSNESFRYNRIFNEDDIGGFCKRCKYRISCKGGCTLNSSTLTGKLRRDPYCFYRIEQELFGRNIDKKVEGILEKYSVNLEM